MAMEGLQAAEGKGISTPKAPKCFLLASGGSSHSSGVF